MDIDYEDLLTSLSRLKKGCRPYVGICANLGPDYYESLDKLFVRWPNYSGERDYPVPSPRSDESPRQAYHQVGDLWAGEYGALRMALLDFCIAEVQRIIEGKADAL